MKLIAYPLAAFLTFFGIMFVVAGASGSGNILTIVVGVILLVSAIAFLWLAMMKPKPIETTLVQKIDLSGDVNIEQMKCRSCGGILNKDSISVRAGGIFINCPYCGSAYQLEEAPKW
jgi:Zn finger protein HypA/HybF involved in hydrogenase expression